MNMKKKIGALLRLQKIDISLNNINELKGSYPQKITEMTKKIEATKDKLLKKNTESSEVENNILEKQKQKKSLSKALKELQGKKISLTNPSEHDSLVKEIELKKVEVQLSDKDLKELKWRNTEILESLGNLERREKDQLSSLEKSKKKLSEIEEKVGEEEKVLIKKRLSAVKNIDKESLGLYEHKIGRLDPFYVITTVKNGACQGCFVRIQPMKQIAVEEQKKLITCEYCGRILSSIELEPNIKTRKKRSPHSLLRKVEQS